MAMEEERRLAFVAITRAEEGLYLSDAEGRNFDNSPRYVSRFILDISPLYLSYDEELPDSLVKDSDRFIKRSENSLLPDLGELGLKVGDRVYLQNMAGQPFPVTVTAKDDTMITLDANHEMAGKELNFRIELVECED